MDRNLLDVAGEKLGGPERPFFIAVPCVIERGLALGPWFPKI